MSNFPAFAPALRSVNSSGAVTYGPTILFQPNSWGIYVEKTDVTYTQERLGPWMNLLYQIRYRFLGYRPHVTLQFKVTDASLVGFSTLLHHFNDAATAESFGGLQFTPFYTGTLADTWRGMTVSSGWEPRAIDGKWRTGYEFTVELEATSLIQTIGDWRASAW